MAPSTASTSTWFTPGPYPAAPGAPSASGGAASARDVTMGRARARPGPLHRRRHRDAARPRRRRARRAAVPPHGDMDWRGARDDVLAVSDHLGVRGGLAVGRSMGGAALLMAEQLRPGTFARLWVYEPIVFPRPEGGGDRVSNPLAESARRRRARFPSRDTAYANYAAKPPLSGLDPAALRAYVDHGFRDVPDDQAVELKCLPAVEAATFEAGGGAGAFEGLGGVEAEVVVAAGGDGAPPAQMASLVMR